MNSTVTRAETAVHVRRVRFHRILYTVCLILSLAALFVLVLNFVRSTVPACILLGLGGIGCYMVYAKVSLANEASISRILTDDLDPELFSLVFRQTLKKSSQFPSLQAIMEVTEHFYLGDYEHVLNAVRHNPRLYHWTQPEFVSYYVQSACALGLEEEAREGLAILAQAHGQKDYEDVAVASMIDRYENLAKAAFHLIREESGEALAAARAVYEDAAAPDLCILYACGYLATAHAMNQEYETAQALREQVLSHCPAFGIVRHLTPREK